MTFKYISYACNEAVCASIVSKCLITQSCKCDLANCSCCKECFSCLSNLYSECCSCVGKSFDSRARYVFIFSRWCKRVQILS